MKTYTYTMVVNTELLFKVKLGFEPEPYEVFDIIEHYCGKMGIKVKDIIDLCDMEGTPDFSGFFSIIIMDRNEVN